MTAPACPVMHSSPKGGSSCPISPDTRMPAAEYLQQSTDDSSAGLSAEREHSSIPRADTDTVWQYPSARMFYNALLRKGKPAPAGAIDDMLLVHNHLNESVWEEIVAKERRLHPTCEPKLKRFLGRPEELSLRAWWHVRARGGEAPFDRHDWTIDRCGCDVRYVIDYYAGHPEPGRASFQVDIRPALDSPQALLDRFRLFWTEKFGGGGNRPPTSD